MQRDASAPQPVSPEGQASTYSHTLSPSHDLNSEAWPATKPPPPSADLSGFLDLNTLYMNDPALYGANLSRPPSTHITSPLPPNIPDVSSDLRNLFSEDILSGFFSDAWMSSLGSAA